jgi:adenylate cyclase
MSLEGERRVMTFLFTDVADFTTLSEGLDSHELARILNSYLDGVTQIVLRHDGMVGKFIGDAVFVIFNAPLDQPDHAERAVRCALEIDRFCQSFCLEQNAKGVPFGLTRIGINTGPAVVGNFGSSSRFSYTATGDAVNTASRLEGINKVLGTRICVAQSTRALCHGIAFRPVAAVMVKGKAAAIEVWEPLHEDVVRAPFLTRYCEAFARLRTLAPDALDLFTALHAEDPKDPCVALHLARLRRGLQGAEIS